MNEENILLKLLKPEPQLLISNITVEQWFRIIELASREHVAAYLYYHLQEAGVLGLIPKSAKEALMQSFKNITFRNMALVAEFRRIADALSKKSIPVIGLKGLHLVDGIYPHIGLRFMRDMDLMVPIEQIKAAYDCTLKLGYQCEKILTEQDFSMQYGHHLYQQFHPQKKMMLELHGYLEDVFCRDPEIWWKNAKVLDHTKQNYIYFDLEDLLLHLCLHISYSDMFKMDLQHYLDIYIILKNKANEIDWDQFLNRAKNRGLTNGVLLVLQITSKLFGHQLPDKLLVVMVNNPKKDELIKYAIELMWQYDKSSKEYEQYKSKIFLFNEPLYKRIFKRVFISKEELSYLYSLNLSSKIVYAYYFRRVYDLFKRHFTNTLLGKTDQKKADTIAKTKILHAYLFDK